MAAKKTKANDIDEATVFFEVVLPKMCEQNAEALRKIGPERHVELRLKARPPRAWVISGGEGPWIERGQVENPDLTVTMTPDFVKLVVHGGEPNLDEAIAAGHLEIGGDLDFLREMGVDVSALADK